jgi:hypothetical protein
VKEALSEPFHYRKSSLKVLMDLKLFASSFLGRMSVPRIYIYIYIYPATMLMNECQRGAGGGCRSGREGLGEREREREREVIEKEGEGVAVAGAIKETSWAGITARLP